MARGNSKNFEEARKRGRPRDPTLKKLTPKQEAAVEWLFHPDVNFVQREALQRAGFSRSTATSNPMGVFGLPHVARRIAEKKEDHKLKFNIDRDWLVQRHAVLANSNIAAIMDKLKKNDFDLGALTWEEQYALREIKNRSFMEGRGEDAIPVTEITIKGAPVSPHLEGLARVLGLNQDKLEITGPSVAEILARGRQRTAKTPTGSK